MIIRPLGKLAGTSSIGEFYKDSEGFFFMLPRTIAEIIEARVTNGRGFITPTDIFDTPYSENPLRDKIDPQIFCYNNLLKDKFPGWEMDLKDGHPDYICSHYEVISLD